ncbi:Uric acid degradation bifunctional protein TTL [Phytophthora nicotianae]|uniref:Uric acid degradation bifunctional protein TTL n=1 Tax=Phytophthora nicotianae TaxID=4792 RepID=A0A0W8CP71_PHYNI|nr:Uric acid degradation bifunctional protein TTL [Phytophthora nicotianae]
MLRGFTLVAVALLGSTNAGPVISTMEPTRRGTFALKQGNAQSGPLQTTYDGARPKGYTVMKKQGTIILGIGGDNSNWAHGSFYEGVMVSGDPTDDVDNQIQANIVAAGYGGESEEPKTFTFSNVGSSSGSA